MNLRESIIEKILSHSADAKCGKYAGIVYHYFNDPNFGLKFSERLKGSYNYVWLKNKLEEAPIIDLTSLLSKLEKHA